MSYTYIFRDFSRRDNEGNSLKHSIGDIFLFVQKNNYIHVSMTGLHGCMGCMNEECESMGYQAYMFIKYAPNLKLYDVIKLILFKLTCDLTYRTDLDRIEPYKDFIITDTSECKNPDIWNFDVKKNACRKIWMPFTENAVKLGYLTIIENYNPEDFECVINRGEVLSNYEFVYDAPIVDIGQTKEYYEKTRFHKKIVNFPMPFLRKNEFIAQTEEDMGDFIANWEDM